MSCCDSTDDTSSNSNSAQKLSAAQNEMLASSWEPYEGVLQIEFLVPGMHCVGCIRSLERLVGELPFVEQVRANLSLKRLSVIWENNSRDNGKFVSEIDQAITNAGFEHSVFDQIEQQTAGENQTSKSLLIALAVAGFAAVNIMLLSVSVWSGADEETTKLFHLISGLIALPAVFFAGQPFFRSAKSALRVGRMNMDVPISLAVLMALAMSLYESLTGGTIAYFDASVTLLFFLLIGRYLDHLMREKARSSVVQLSSLAAKGAMCVGEKGELSYVKLNEISPGMILRIVAGERIGVDGVVTTGKGDIDRSLVTGESTPILVEAGSKVEAGTLNLNGVIEIKVLRDANHSFLAEIARMMEVAEKGRGRFSRIADRAASIYAPAVHLLAILAFIGWMIATWGDWHASIYVAISVLIITCPCALGLAVPVVHVIAARRLLREGIIIRDGSGFERLEQIDHIVFDKTGTLTSGSPRVCKTSVVGSRKKSIVKTLALHSNHPFSHAVSEYLKSSENTDIKNIREIPGCGVEGIFKGMTVRLGRNNWVKQIAGKNKKTNGEEDNRLSFAIKGRELQTFDIREELRQSAVDTIDSLKMQNFDLEILSGDNLSAVERVAQMIGVQEYQGELSPLEKTTRINEIREDGKKVLMVGDGLNDSPALAAANVSIAPASASDIARQAADFVFTGHSLAAVPYAIKIARRTGALVRQNFALAIAYNAIAIPFAIAGLVTPLFAAIAMSLSSIVVVANSMRLNSGVNDLLAPTANSTSAPNKTRSEICA